MNLQPRQVFASFRPLRLPLLVSLLLHGALMWPAPLRQRPDAGPSSPVTVRLKPQRPALTEQGERVPGPAYGAITRPSDVASRPASVRSMPAPPSAQDGVEVARLPAEGALRALRYAVAKELVQAAWPDPSALPSVFTVALHVRARRVVEVTLSSGNDRPEMAAALRAAFKAAAQRAVIPDSLPAEGFTVELELEAGEAERPDHERSPASG